MGGGIDERICSGRDERILTIEDPTGRRFGRTVTNAFFEEIAVGEQVVKDAGSEIRRRTT